MSKPILMIAIVGGVCVAGWLLILLSNRRLRQHIRQLSWSAQHDDLTGLLNRAGLLDRYGQLADWPRNLMVFLINVDGFKTVNSRFGHRAGDDLLCQAAQRIDELTNSLGGFAARLPGDRFVAIIEWRHHDISHVADRFARATAEPIAITVDGQEVLLRVTASVGAAWVDSRDPLDEVVLRRTDIAMFHAKCDGGDRYTVFEPGMTMPPPIST